MADINPAYFDEQGFDMSPYTDERVYCSRRRIEFVRTETPSNPGHCGLLIVTRFEFRYLLDPVPAGERMAVKLVRDQIRQRHHPERDDIPHHTIDPVRSRLRQPDRPVPLAR